MHAMLCRTVLRPDKEIMPSGLEKYRMKQKTGTFETPQKIEEIQEKKFIDRN